MPYLEKLGKTIYSNDRVSFHSFEDLQPDEILNLADIAEANVEEFNQLDELELENRNLNEKPNESLQQSKIFHLWLTPEKAICLNHYRKAPFPLQPILF